jgi:translation initiation factor IF-3
LENRINEQIGASEVILIDENGKSLGVVPRDEALKRAQDQGLDLVQVASGANPPVTKILDYKKFLYSKEKEKRKQRASQRKKGLKEIRISLSISPHDLEVKQKRAKEFLKDGHKLRISLKLIGRENKFGEKGFEIIKNFCQDIDAQIEERPKREGSVIFALAKR